MNNNYYFRQEGRKRLINVRAATPQQAVTKLVEAWFEELLSYSEAKATLEYMGVEGPLEIEIIP